jgi:hypothetical protein
VAPLGSVVLHPGKPCRLVEEPCIRDAGGVVDQIDRSGALACGEVEPPAGIGPVQMQNAGALAARTASGQIRAPQSTPIMRQLRLGKEWRQPVAGGVRKPGPDRAQIMASGRRP